MTGLANRRDLDIRLLTLAVHDTVVICDLDRFKQFNDAHGHLAGDRLLRDFGELLRTQLRTDDYAARYGGEELALVLPNTSPADAAAVLRRLHTQWAILRPGCTFSSGIAGHRTDHNGSGTMASADAALFEAKRNGRDRDQVARTTVTARVC